MTRATARPRTLGEEWLGQRDYPDLDPRAERALRAAGWSFQDDEEAKRRLAEAESYAPGHIAVLIAHYRYHLYKHRFGEAEGYARECLTRAARELAIPIDYLDVRGEHADFSQLDPQVRFWLFALQAYGYVLLRCGREREGVDALRHLADLDRGDQTKTRVLLDVIARRGQDDEEQRARPT